MDWGGSHTFQIRMEQDAQALCRIIGLFAQRDLLIKTLTLTEDQASHNLVLEVSSVSADRADTIANKLRNLIDVHEVELICQLRDDRP